jgi:hypothetical protein
VALSTTQSELKKIMKKDHVGYMKAIAEIVMDDSLVEYSEFVDGIEDELSVRDKLNIFCGFVKNRAAFWEEASDEEREEKVRRIIEIYEDLKTPKRRGRK